MSYNKPIKQIIEILEDKWKNVRKKYKNVLLYLIPLEDLWIPNEITLFSTEHNNQAFDIGDIYTGYGSPNTNRIYMQYQWSEFPQTNANKDQLNSLNNIANASQIQSNGENNNLNPLLNAASNSLLAQPTINERSVSMSPNCSKFLDDEINKDSLSNDSDSEDDKKSFPKFGGEFSEYEFDPLEFLGVGENNSSDGEEDELDLAFDDQNIWQGECSIDLESEDIKRIKNIECKDREKSVLKTPSHTADNNKDDKEINVKNKNNVDDQQEKQIKNEPNKTTIHTNPFDGIDFFNRLRKNSKEDSGQAGGVFNNNNTPAFQFSESNSNKEISLQKTNNVIVANNSNSCTRVLNFNDFNSMIKSNSLQPKVNNFPSNLNSNKELQDSNIYEEKPKTEDVIESSKSTKRPQKRIPFTNNVNVKVSHTEDKSKIILEEKIKSNIENLSKAEIQGEPGQINNQTHKAANIDSSFISKEKLNVLIDRI